MTDDDVLDLARLIEAYDNDAPSIARLLTLACRTERRYIRALRNAIEHADLVAIASAAHSIKGSASNIGAGKVSSVAARIEDGARSGSWDGIAEAAAELDGDYAELCRRISDYAATIA